MSEQEPGSDTLMGPEHMEAIQHKLDLELAAVVEEDRKTEAATPSTDPDA